MHPPLGLSIGTTNFVAVSAGEPPVIRRSLLTLPPQGSPQLGSPAERADSTETGLLVDGFVDCVGDQVPLVATDGSTHQPELLLVDAIDAMVGAAGADVSQLAIAVPAHWPPAAWQALQEALQSRASLSALGAPPFLVSDAVAALTALHANRGVASRGVVALLDFGGGGTNISLADAASGFQPIGETMRYGQFSGKLVDQAILSYIVGGTDQGGAADPDTATVGDLAQLTDECRQAKERLSEQTATELIAALPGYDARIALTRAEFDDLIRRPLDGVIVALEQLLQRNTIDWRDLAAIATVGGGARIPLITERLSAGHQVPMVTSQLPALAMAVGAALSVTRGAGIGAAEEAPATAMAPVTPARATARNGGAGQPDPAPNELAWSEEEIRDEPVPFIGEPYSVPSSSPTRIGSEKGRRSHRVPQLVFGFAALAAMIGVGGVTYTLTSASHGETPAKPANGPTAQVAPPSPEQPVPPQAAAPPSAPPAGPAAPPPPPPATTTDPPATTTAPPRTTTTTTTAPATTTTPTTTAAPTITKTTAPPSNTAATTAPTAAPMTTEYLTLPLVPVPIPIQVPAN